MRTSLFLIAPGAITTLTIVNAVRPVPYLLPILGACIVGSYISMGFAIAKYPPKAMSRR